MGDDWNWQEVMQKLGYCTLQYDQQWNLLKRAQGYGWQGKMPSVLGTYNAECALREAATFLLEHV
jgi:hypothetical protein